jgi:aromatic-L-amino-acid decarboxylase
LPARAPERGESFDDIFGDFERVIVPGLTHWNHPGFFAYFDTSASGPGILAEMLSAGLNQQAMLWRTSPAATELEEVALGWLRHLMGLPASFEGVIYDTASVTTLHALAAAREDVAPDMPHERDERQERSPAAPRLLLGAHALVDRQGGDPAGPRTAGDSADSRGRALRDGGRSIWPRRSPTTGRAGVVPMAVVATIGTTSSTAIDPVDAIAACARAKRSGCTSMPPTPA